MRVMMELKPMVAKNQIPLISCIQVSKEATTSGLAHLCNNMVALIVLSKIQKMGIPCIPLCRNVLPHKYAFTHFRYILDAISGMGIDLYLHCVKFFASFFNRMP